VRRLSLIDREAVRDSEPYSQGIRYCLEALAITVAAFKARSLALTKVRREH
jgi:hypothetical protein